MVRNNKIALTVLLVLVLGGIALAVRPDRLADWSFIVAIGIGVLIAVFAPRGGSGSCWRWRRASESER